MLNYAAGESSVQFTRTEQCPRTNCVSFVFTLRIMISNVCLCNSVNMGRMESVRERVMKRAIHFWYTHTMALIIQLQQKKITLIHFNVLFLYLFICLSVCPSGSQPVCLCLYVCLGRTGRESVKISTLKSLQYFSTDKWLVLPFLFKLLAFMY